MTSEKLTQILELPSFEEQHAALRKFTLTREGDAEVMADPRFGRWLNANREAILDQATRAAFGKKVCAEEAADCPTCGKDGWLISQRDDGYAAVETCDECQVLDGDETAAIEATRRGVICDLSYPCYVLALPAGWGKP